jgi:hypothetical protein
VSFSGVQDSTWWCARQQQFRHTLTLLSVSIVIAQSQRIMTTNISNKQAVTMLDEQQASGRPVWIRPPKVGIDFHCGFSRSKLYELEALGHIRGVSIREPGRVKGTKLFHLQSILDFIEQCEREQAQKSSADDFSKAAK